MSWPSRPASSVWYCQSKLEHLGDHFQHRQRGDARAEQGNETRRKAAIEFVTKGLETGALKPVIDRTFTFDEMADVHRYLEQSGQFGKIVVTV